VSTGSRRGHLIGNGAALGQVARVSNADLFHTRRRGGYPTKIICEMSSTTRVVDAALTGCRDCYAAGLGPTARQPNVTNFDVKTERPTQVRSQRRCRTSRVFV